jgi:hypothetical protein
VDPVLYSAMDEDAPYELLPVRMLGIRQADAEHPDGWHVSWLDAGHKALGPLAEPPSLYQSALVYRYVHTAASQDAAVDVLARLDNQQPLLIERRIGAGSVLLLATSVHVDWSNLPLRPIFMPLISRLTFYLAEAETTRPPLAAGTPLVVPLAGMDVSTVEVTRPTGDVTRLEVDERDTFRFLETHEIGVYEVTLTGVNRQENIAFACNTDPEEVSPEILGRDTLQKKWGPAPLLFCESADDLADTIRTLREGESLWELFLVVVLIALVGEAFLANRRVTAP